MTCDLEDKNPGSQVGLEAFCGSHSRSGLFPPPPGRLCGSGSALLRVQRGEGARVGSRSPDFHTFLGGKGLSKFKARPRKAESPPAPPAPPVPTLQQPLVPSRCSPLRFRNRTWLCTRCVAAQPERHVSKTPRSGRGHGIKRSRGHLGMRGQGHPSLAGGTPPCAQTRVVAGSTPDLAMGTGAGTLLGAAGPLGVLQGLEGKQSRSLAGTETSGSRNYGLGHLPRQRALGMAHARPEIEGRGPNVSQPVFLRRLDLTRGALPHVCSLLPTLCPARPKPRAHLGPSPQGTVPCLPQPSAWEGSHSSRHSRE